MIDIAALIGRRFRNRHKHSIVVQLLACVEMRQAASRKQLGVLYQRLDRDDELGTVRTINEFMAKFELQPLTESAPHV